MPNGRKELVELKVGDNFVWNSRLFRAKHWAEDIHQPNSQNLVAVELVSQSSSEGVGFYLDDNSHFLILEPKRKFYGQFRHYKNGKDYWVYGLASLNTNQNQILVIYEPLYIPDKGGVCFARRLSNFLQVITGTTKRFTRVE